MEPTREQNLQIIGDVIEHWLNFVTQDRFKEGLPTNPDTHVILGYENAPPVWPSVGVLTRWLEVIRAGRESGA